MNDTNLNRALGRLEGQLEGIVATLKRVDDRSAARDKTLEGVLERLDTMEAHAEAMAAVAAEFSLIKQIIRDRKMQGKGILIGIGIAGGVSGATVAAFFKQLWAGIFPQ